MMMEKMEMIIIKFIFHVVGVYGFTYTFNEFSFIIGIHLEF